MITNIMGCGFSETSATVRDPTSPDFHGNVNRLNFGRTGTRVSLSKKNLKSGNSKNEKESNLLQTTLQNSNKNHSQLVNHNFKNFKNHLANTSQGSYAKSNSHENE